MKNPEESNPHTLDTGFFDEKSSIIESAYLRSRILDEKSSIIKSAYLESWIFGWKIDDNLICISEIDDFRMKNLQ
jgi:hypothetical protein